MLTLPQIRDLISVYDLDPNRVQDLILDCLELSLLSAYGNSRKSPITKTAQSQRNVDKFYELLGKFHPEKNLVHLLGFKLLYYERREVERVKAIEEKRKMERDEKMNASSLGGDNDGKKKNAPEKEVSEKRATKVLGSYVVLPVCVLFTFFCSLHFTLLHFVLLPLT